MADDATQRAVAQYLEAGFALCRVKPGSKAPSRRNWQREPLRDPAQFAGAGVGLIHGLSGTCALDVDDLAGAEAWLANHGVDLRQLLEDDNAARIDSGRENRAKLLYRVEEILPSARVYGADGGMLLELRCDGSQDVLPPSIHPDTGKPYRWAGAGDWRNLPELPAALLSLWYQVRAPQAGENRADAHQGGENLAGAQIAEGGRNTALTKLAASLRAKSLSDRAIFAALKVVNEQRCVPPLDLGEVRKIAKWAGGFAPGLSAQYARRAQGREQRQPGEAPPAYDEHGGRVSSHDDGHGHHDRAVRHDGDHGGEAPAEHPPTIDGAELAGMDLAPLSYVAQPWIVEGVSLIVGKPKMGKSTLLRQLALAIRTEDRFFGARCTRARVLYLSLEEGERLMHMKLRAMSPEETTVFEGIDFAFHWPCGGDGVAHLRWWLKQHAQGQSVVIVIDSLTRFRDPLDPRTPVFQQDYECVRMLADLCKEWPGLVVLVLHHVRKASSEEPIDCISGTYGLVAAADNYMVMMSQGGHFRLHCGGRMWESEQTDFEIERRGGRWELAGSWQPEFVLTPLQQTIYDAIKAQGGSASVSGICEGLGMDPHEAKQKVANTLQRIEKLGVIERSPHGGWTVTGNKALKHGATRAHVRARCR